MRIGDLFEHRKVLYVLSPLVKTTCNCKNNSITKQQNKHYRKKTLFNMIYLQADVMYKVMTVEPDACDEVNSDFDIVEVWISAILA